MNRFNLMTFTAAVALTISACVSTTRAGGEPTALMSKAAPLYLAARAGN